MTIETWWFITDGGRDGGLGSQSIYTDRLKKRKFVGVNAFLLLIFTAISLGLEFLHQPDLALSAVCILRKFRAKENSFCAVLG